MATDPNDSTTTNDAPAQGKTDVKTEAAPEAAPEKPAKPKKAAKPPKSVAEAAEKLAEERKTVVEDVPLGDVVAEDNIRSELPKMDEMTDSVKKKGVIQPVIGMRLPDGKRKLIAGFRRFFGSKAAGKATIPMRVLEADQVDQLGTALVENLQREDMNPLDKALALQKYMTDNKLDQKQMAAELSVSDGFVSQHLALLKLPKQAQNAVKNGKITLAHARLLGRIKDEEKLLDLLKLAQELTVSQLQDKVEAVVAKEKAKAEAEAAKADKPKKTRKAAGEGDEDGDGDDGGGGKPVKKSLAEQYAEMEMEPLKKTDMREQLAALATRLDKAKTDESRSKYKYMLAGMEIAAGLKKL